MKSSRNTTANREMRTIKPNSYLPFQLHGALLLTPPLPRALPLESPVTPPVVCRHSIRRGVPLTLKHLPLSVYPFSVLQWSVLLSNPFTPSCEKRHSCLEALTFIFYFITSTNQLMWYPAFKYLFIYLLVQCWVRHIKMYFRYRYWILCLKCI